MSLKIKRIYDVASVDDGCKKIIARLWPHRSSKQRAALDEWLKDVAPFPELRSWFGRQPERYKEFKLRYAQERDFTPAVIELQNQIETHKSVTLLYTAHGPVVNYAPLLLAYLK